MSFYSCMGLFPRLYEQGDSGRLRPDLSFAALSRADPRPIPVLLAPRNLSLLGVWQPQLGKTSLEARPHALHLSLTFLPPSGAPHLVPILQWSWLAQLV